LTQINAERERTPVANPLKFVLPDGWQRAKGFSYGVTGTGREPLYVAGQLAVVKGAPEPEDGMAFADQFRLSLSNVVQVVESAGGTAADIASLRVFVTSIESFKGAQAAIASAWAQLLGKHFPAMTLIEVSALFEKTAAVEIEAVALLRKETTP
jgi:enamine deaminase RidA (YjgF/YER057c/UK114 family)